MSTVGLPFQLPVSLNQSGDTDEAVVGLAVAGVGTLGRFRHAPPRESNRLLGALRQRRDALERAELARWQRESGGKALTPPVQRKGRGDGQFSVRRGASPVRGRHCYHVATTDEVPSHGRGRNIDFMNASNLVVAGETVSARRSNAPE